MSEQGTAPRRRRGARWVGVAAAGSLTIGAGAVVSPPAHAQADTFLGVHSPSIIASNGKTRKVHFGTLGYGDVDTLGVDARIATPDKLRTAGSAVVDNLEVAYVVDRYIHTPNRFRAAAVSWYVRKRVPDGHLADAKKAMKALKAKNHAAYTKIMAQYSTISAAVKKWVGPYEVEPTISAADGDQGTVGGLGVKAASGAWIDGKKVTVTLTGATFAGGAASKSATTKRSPLTWAWKATGDGRVSAKVTVSKLKATGYRVYHAAKKGKQRLVAPGPSAVVTKTVHQRSPVQVDPPSRLTPQTSPPTSSTSPTPTSGGSASPAAYLIDRQPAMFAAGVLASALNRPVPTTNRG